jgi:hypothetical protein
MMRTFRVAEGRVVVLPRDVLAGPGDINFRYEAGDTFELPDERVTRFVRRRINLYDLVELKLKPASAAVPLETESPEKSAER